MGERWFYAEVAIPALLTTTSGKQPCRYFAGKAFIARARKRAARLSGHTRRHLSYFDGSGSALFQQVCELDLEGIVAKHKFGPYVTERESSTWIKILNRTYSQKQA
jgi:ATP-dependent DNA ligase